MARTTFIVDDPSTRNIVLVRSRAPLETILVRTNHVTGEIELDVNDIADHPRATFQVPLDSLDTGIPLMNEVMRTDQWLDATKYRAATFRLTRVLVPANRIALEAGMTLSVPAEATLELRGIPRTVAVRADVTWHEQSEDTGRRLPGDLLHIVATFDVPLLAFGIEAYLSPRSRDKVAGTLQVEVDLFASTERPQVTSDTLERLARARKQLGQRLLAS